MNFLKIFLRNLKHGPYTVAYPFGPAYTPDKLRGRVAFDVADCTGCRACEQSCAPGAIRIDRVPDGLRLAIWHNSCTFCGLCQFYCPTKAIHLTNDWHLSHTADRQFEYLESGVIPYTSCAVCGVKTLASAPNVVGIDPPLDRDQFEQLRNRCAGCRKDFLEARGN